MDHRALSVAGLPVDSGRSAEIRPAGHLWGKTDTYQTQRVIREEVGESQAKVASIGQAGENLIPFANIMSDHGRAAGRTGMGALMGSKNLKALAVCGTGTIPLAQEQDYKDLRSAANKTLHDQNMTSVLHAVGTGGSADYFQMLGDMPQKYWTAATFEGAGRVSGSEMRLTILTGTKSCQGCVIGCGREVFVQEGPYATEPKSKGPEYETICAFGSQLLVDDLPMITKLGDICDRYGMDTISAGSTIGLAYLLFDRGIISEAQTGGLALHWGDGLPAFNLLEKMAVKEGFGAQLAEGSLALATHYGDQELAVQVNELDVPMHDPRASRAGAGICHLAPGCLPQPV